MKRIINIGAHTLLRISLIGALLSFAFFSAKLQHAPPSIDRIRAPANVSEASPLYRGARISRLSAIKVLSVSPDTAELFSSTGTYVSLDNRYFILTTAHGITSDCELIKFMSPASNGAYVDCKKIVVINSFVDYAIVEVEKIETATPVDIATGVPNQREWEQSFAALSELVYSGYPNSVGIVTISGRVMGFSRSDIVFLHSYGWSGASGSGVFNKEGQLVGYVSAILIGESEYGTSVLEDVVIVVPLFNVNWSLIYHR